jgi:hypothetical protein
MRQDAVTLDRNSSLNISKACATLFNFISKALKVSTPSYNLHLFGIVHKETTRIMPSPSDMVMYMYEGTRSHGFATSKLDLGFGLHTFPTTAE